MPCVQIVARDYGSKLKTFPPGIVSFVVKVLKYLMFSCILTLIGATYVFAGARFILPQENKNPVQKELLKPLQIYSQALAELAKSAKRAVVFVSVSKRIDGRPLGAIDPYELFRNRNNFQTPPEFQENFPEPVKPFGMGSGFFIDVDAGYVVTNYHVIKNAEVISLRLANDSVEDARLIGKDVHADLVVLKIINKNFDRSNLDHLILDDLKNTHEGELVMVAGSPFGLEGSLSLGIISAIGRGNLQITRVGDFLQTDAAVNPGNSGGPLLNMYGRAIGINTAIFTRSGGSSGISFAIPSTLAAKVIEEIIRDGRVHRGFLGVNVQKLDQELRELLNLSPKISGVLVQDIARDSPAYKIKINIGDVIVSVNGKSTPDENTFFSLLSQLSPGSQVLLKFVRRKKVINMSVPLSEWPEEESMILAMENKLDQFAKKFGFLVVPKPKNLRGNPARKIPYGLFVKQILNGSPAERMGLKEGDIITSFNDESLRSVDQLQILLGKHQRFVLKIYRSGSIFFLPYSG